MGAMIGKYYDYETGRERWAVVVGSVWYFPTRYGKYSKAKLFCPTNQSN